MEKEAFMSSRRCFAFFPNESLIWCPVEMITMACRDWLADEYNISEETYDTLVHGSIHTDGHVVISLGSSYQPIDMNTISESDMYEIVAEACRYAKCEKVEVYNGVNVGEVGERWTPINNLGYFKP